MCLSQHSSVDDDGAKHDFHLGISVRAKAPGGKQDSACRSALSPLEHSLWGTAEGLVK